MNLAHYLETSAQCFPRHPVVREESGDTTYGELNETANRVASALMKLGVEPGDPVALCAPNSGDWMAFYFGVLKAGAVAVTLSYLLKSMEFNSLIRHAGPRIVYADETRVADLEAFKDSDNLETIVCPGGDKDLPELIDLGTSRFRTVDRERKDT
ncbi:MAG: class I adenylate-forming enzyme family protein [Acidobacteriota bacterium]